MHCNYYTVRCNCVTLTTSVTKEAVEQGGEPYAIDVAHQRWKEVVDKMHMTKENPGSEEETGVDADAVWDAVLGALEVAFWNGNQYRSNNAPLGNDRYIICENILKEKLNEVLEDDDLPF